MFNAKNENDARLNNKLEKLLSQGVLATSLA